MKVGTKIRKLRELKNINPKDMADRLNLSPGGYAKLERDDVSITLERLEEIAGIFEMKPEDLLTFDEKLVFNNHAEIKGSLQGIHYGTFNSFPDEIKRLYEENTKLQADKILVQEQLIEMLQQKVRSLEGK